MTVLGGYGTRFGLQHPPARGAAAADDAAQIVAPMAGRVVRVAAQAGARIAAGDRLAVLEAMKMAHVLRARRDGRGAEEAAQVAAGAALIRLETTQEDA